MQNIGKQFENLSQIHNFDFNIHNSDVDVPGMLNGGNRFNTGPRGPGTCCLV